MPSPSRRHTIIQAALRCFAQHGVEATTIDMIREASGASVGSLYHHFGNKEGIAAEVYVEGLRQARLQTRAALAGCTSLEAAVRGIVRAQVDWIVANPDWARFVFSHRMVLGQAGREDSFRAEISEAQQELSTALQALPGSERLRQWPAGIYPSLLVGPVHNYAQQWLEGRRQVPLDELREVFAQAAWQSLGG
jgi:AcrR family transcriptional regulator